MRRALVLVGIAALVACRGAGTSGTDAPEKQSPQASAQPALLAAATAPPSATPVAGALEGGPPPSPLRGDEALVPDSLLPETMEVAGAPRRVAKHESAGYTLSAVLRPADIVGPPRNPEVNNAGLDAARKATDLRLAIDLSPSRMRVVLQGRGFVLPSEMEIRARSDRYGHVVIWPGAAAYRPLAPGAARAFLGERRFDVAPITSAQVTPRGDGARRIGIRTHRIDVTTRAGEATFEIGKLEGAGEGGVLLCRLLLDLMNAPPGTAVCAADELPVRAELRWTDHGALAFELTGSLRRTDIPSATLLTPPPTASFASALLPVSGIAPMLTPGELTALRLNDVDVPPAPNVPDDVLVVANNSLALRVLFLDGVPIAWAAPGARGEIRGLHRGRYTAQWRTFLGDSVEAPVTQNVPGTLGASLDAGK